VSVKTTLPYPEDERAEPIHTLTIEVVDGPDRGLTCTAQTETLTIGSAEGNDAVLKDDTVSRFHLELRRCDEGVCVRDLSSTNGTWIGNARIVSAIVQPDTNLRVGRSVLAIHDGKPSHVDLHPTDHLGDIWGATPTMRRLMARVHKAASSDVGVLIVGESGTGKELVANALHTLSKRAAAPFVTVDCGALAPNLVASELFGHEKGAFTGADRQHVGAFERAAGGTLFLDEVGELPRDLQPTLLGVLERRRVRRVGGRADIDVDVRVVAATHRDLRAEVNAGSFRLDLYYRLAVVTLTVAPLRERRADVPLLVRRFLEEAGQAGKAAEIFPDHLMAALEAHHWPGNVRELRNVVEATLAMGETPDVLPSPNLVDGSEPSATSNDAIGLDPIVPLAYKDARAALLREFERRYVEHWLDHAGGNVAEAARGARMDRSHLFHLIKRHRLRQA
jgi:DNA-binding NtrC family response regulator